MSDEWRHSCQTSKQVHDCTNEKHQRKENNLPPLERAQKRLIWRINWNQPSPRTTFLWLTLQEAAVVTSQPFGRRQYNEYVYQGFCGDVAQWSRWSSLDREVEGKNPAEHKNIKVTFYFSVLNSKKCNLGPGVTFKSIIQWGTSIEQHWICLTARDNYKLKTYSLSTVQKWLTNMKHCLRNKSIGE